MARTRSINASPDGGRPSVWRPPRIWASLSSQRYPSTCRIRSSNSSSAGGRKTDALARQPLKRAVLAGVDHRVRSPPFLQPAVEGEVVMRRRQVGRVVHRYRILAKTPRGLHGHKDAAEIETGENQIAA